MTEDLRTYFINMKKLHRKQVVHLQDALIKISYYDRLGVFPSIFHCGLVVKALGWDSRELRSILNSAKNFQCDLRQVSWAIYPCIPTFLHAISHPCPFLHYRTTLQVFLQDTGRSQCFLGPESAPLVEKIFIFFFLQKGATALSMP